jgi:dolichol-phosphate mannosyltransferase
MSARNIKISVVSPVYRTEKIVDELCNRLIKNLETITSEFEIILVDDCSPDNSWKEIENNTQNDSRIKGLKLSRNFGQHHAITAGLDHAEGEWIVVMDCDLQDRPEEIKSLFEKANEGYDIVYAKRVDRKDSFFKKLNSKLFYIVLSSLSGMKFNGEIGNFGIYRKSVIESVKLMKEPFRFFVTSVKWVGFKSSSIPVEHDKRYEGKSSYSFSKLISLGLNISISYTNKPLKLFIYIGFLMALVSILIIIWSLYKKWTGEITELGYTSIICSIWFLSGLIISAIGVVGIYIGKIYDGIKNRPLYIISEKINY